MAMLERTRSAPADEDHREVLVGDIGGTHARFRLLGCSDGRWQVRGDARFPSASCPSLEASVERALAALASSSRGNLRGAWLAVAGPVAGGRGRLTNLDWNVDAEALARACRLDEVHVVNDLEALAFGMAALEEDEVLVLQDGTADATAMHVVIAVGTGLGVAAWRRRGEVVEVFASEGGHADLAACNAHESKVFADLAARHGHVSWERVLSGAGLVELYDVLNDPHPQERPGEAAAIARLACAERDERASAATAMFIDVLAGFAGNAALQWLARGGVYLTGGVVDGLLPLLERERGFMERFKDKGRMSALLTELKVGVALAPDLGLAGVGLMARQGRAAT